VVAEEELIGATMVEVPVAEVEQFYGDLNLFLVMKP
jgi:hypothetical protein